MGFGVDTFSCRQIIGSNDNIPVYCVWWDFFEDPEYQTHAQKEIIIQVHSNTSLLLTEAVPKFSQGIQIISYETAFTTKVLQPEKNTVTFTIDETPVFLTENNHFFFFGSYILMLSNISNIIYLTNSIVNFEIR